MLHRYYGTRWPSPGASDISGQLNYVATHYRRPYADRGGLRRARGRQPLEEVLDSAAPHSHDVMWAMVSDIARGRARRRRPETATTSPSGRFVIGGANLGPRVVAAYRRAEQKRKSELEEFMTGYSIPHTTVGGSTQIRTRLVGMTEVFARAG